MEFLLKYRTTTPEGHPTFDNEKYYNDMATDEMVALRDKNSKRPRTQSRLCYKVLY